MVLIFRSNFMQQGKYHLLFIKPRSQVKAAGADNVDKASGLRSATPEHSAIVHGCPHCLPSRNRLWVQLWLWILNPKLLPMAVPLVCVAGWVCVWGRWVAEH